MYNMYVIIQVDQIIINVICKNSKKIFISQISNNPVIKKNKTNYTNIDIELWIIVVLIPLL